MCTLNGAFAVSKDALFIIMIITTRILLIVVLLRKGWAQITSLTPAESLDANAYDAQIERQVYEVFGH